MEVMISDVFDQAESITIYRNGNVTRYLPSQMSYKLVINGFKNMLAGARPMPAFGVSIDGETRTAMMSGTWVQFEFGKPMVYEEMTFEKLLVRVVAEYSGFNIVRYNSGSGYDGRCYYFDINGNMGEFLNIIQSV